MTYIQDLDARGDERFYAEQPLDFECVQNRISKGDVLLVQFDVLPGLDALDRDPLSERPAAVQLLHPYQQGYKVDSAGMISLPILGEVALLGLTFDQAEKKLVTLLEEMYPSASARVFYLNHFITITGQVGKPGKFPLYDNLNLIEALALAGDVLEYGDRSNVTIIREEDGETRKITLDLTDINAARNMSFCVRNRDVIMIPPLTRRPLANNRAQWILGSITTLVSLTSLIITISNQ